MKTTTTKSAVFTAQPQLVKTAESCFEGATRIVKPSILVVKEPTAFLEYTNGEVVKQVMTLQDYEKRELEATEKFLAKPPVKLKARYNFLKSFL